MLKKKYLKQPEEKDTLHTNKKKTKDTGDSDFFSETIQVRRQTEILKENQNCQGRIIHQTKKYLSKANVK